MKLKYKNLSLTLDEDIENLKKEISELEKLNAIIRRSVDYHLLEGKTQLIGKNSLEILRDRKKHTDGTTSIAKRVIRLLYETAVDEEMKENEIYKLNLQRELLYAQIIAESHDLGHTPFGHLGERTLNKCFQQANLTKKDLDRILAERREMYGEEYEMNQGHNDTFAGNISFEHNEQSAKLIFELIKKSDIDKNKIDFNRIIQGILSHSTSRVTEDSIPEDLVIQVIRQADKIDYINGDIDEVSEIISMDVLRNSKLIELVQIPKIERIKNIVQKLVDETIEKGCIDDHMEGMRELSQIKGIYQPILFSMDTDGKAGLLTGENVERITLIITKLYEYYKNNPSRIPYKSLHYITPIDTAIPSKRILIEGSDLQKDITVDEKIINLLGRMDNDEIEALYKHFIKERILNGEGHGIEPISPEEIEQIKKNYYTQRIKMEKVRQEIDGTEHSDSECEEALKLSISKLIQYALTQKGRDRMVEVRKLHEKENKVDEESLKLMDFYDRNPLERLKLQQEKAEPIMENIRNNWQGESR